MNIFDQGKKMLELRAQQKKLAKMNIEVEENDVKVTMGGDFKIKDLIITVFKVLHYMKMKWQTD